MADSKRIARQDPLILQKAKLMNRVLKTLRARDREILARFYLEEQPYEQICREMELTETQFRLFKSKAAAKLSKAVSN